MSKIGPANPKKNIMFVFRNLICRIKSYFSNYLLNKKRIFVIVSSRVIEWYFIEFILKKRVFSLGFWGLNVCSKHMSIVGEMETFTAAIHIQHELNYSTTKF